MIQRNYVEALKEFEEECYDIAQECEDEGYPSHGYNYELRIEGIKEYYPELFGEVFL